MDQIRGIALEGGGVAGTGHAGAIRVLEELGIYSRLTHFAGSSAGSMVAALMACRVSPEQIQEILLTLDFRRLTDHSWGYLRDAYRLWSEFGWNPGQAVEEVFGEVLQQQVGDRDITYRQVRDRFGSTLITTSTDLGAEGTIYRTPETTPDLPILKGIRESTSIPIFYCPVRADGTMYVDGGLLNNYPIRKLYDYLPPEQVIGCKLVDSRDRSSARKLVTRTLPTNLTSYASLIVTLLHDLNIKAHVDEDDWKRTIKIDVGSISATDFDITLEGKQQLIQNGEMGARKFFDK